MNKDDTAMDIIDLGAASVETQGKIYGLPEDVASAQQFGISDE